MQKPVSSKEPFSPTEAPADLYSDDDTEAPSATVELTARVAAESAAAAASSGAASSHVDKMVALGGKMYAKPQNPAELLLRFKKDAKNMKESRRKQKKTAVSKMAAAPPSAN